MHDHGILSDIFFVSRQLEKKYCQTLGYKPNLSIPVIFDRFTFEFMKKYHSASSR